MTGFAAGAITGAATVALIWLLVSRIDTYRPRRQRPLRRRIRGHVNPTRKDTRP